MSEETISVPTQKIILEAIALAGGKQTVDRADDEGEIVTVEETEDQWLGRVAENARTIYMVMNDKDSPVREALKRLEESTPYPANIVKVVKEKTSNRAVVHLETKPTKRNPEGRETLRTDRFDEGGRPLATMARNHAGRRVMVWKYMEPATDGSGEKYRILAHLKDLGEARPFSES